MKIVYNKNDNVHKAENNQVYNGNDHRIFFYKRFLTVRI